VGDNVSIDIETLLLIDFVNLEIKLTQYFEGAHRGKVHVHIFIKVSSRMCMNICVFIVFLKKKQHHFRGNFMTKTYIVTKG
jgi:hypothetical protein